MLVLTRCLRERIRIETAPGIYIWIAILEIDHGKCRLGIDAPYSYNIVREELLEDKEKG